MQQGVRVRLCCCEVPLWGQGETNPIDHVLCAAQYGNIEYICTDVSISSLNSHKSSRTEIHVFCLQNKKAEADGCEISWGYIARLKIIKIKFNSKTINMK